MLPYMIVSLSMLAYLIVSILVIVASVIYCIPRRLVVRLARRYPEVKFYFAPAAGRPPPVRSAVAITIDDAPSPNTQEISAVLKRHNARATWFVIGGNVERCDPRSAGLCALLRDGHELGNHTMEDVRTSRLAEPELQKSLHMTHLILDHALWLENKRTEIRWFRPGCGWFNEHMVAIAKRMGYQTVLGSVYPHDPQIHVPSLNAWNILTLHAVQPGDIIIIHDRKWTPPMLETVLTELEKRGFEFVTLSELAAIYNNT